MGDSESIPVPTRKETLRARKARKQASVAEQIAWEILRDRKTGFKFRREYPVRPYRLDFYCAEAKFAIEFDGEQHDPARDAIRDAYLARYGILVYRIPNREFFEIDGEGRMVDHLGIALKICAERAEALREADLRVGD